MTVEPRRALRILVVDDDDDQRFLLRRLFAKAGYDDVVEGVDGADAVRKAVEHDPDLIVLDLAMPGGSGLDALPELQRQAPRSQVVMCSSFPRRRMAALARERGAVGYVEKQVGPERLVDEILVAAALVVRVVDRISTRFAADPTAPSQARQTVRSVLDAADEQLVSSVELLVSELVTNAVLHASSAPVLDIHLGPDRVRIEVRDDDPTMPRRRVPDEDSPGGRGLLLLDRLASRWGAEPDDDGKVVWVEFDREPIAGR